MKLKSLLIIDDEPMIHEVLTAGLAEAAEKIESCYTLNEAMSCIEAKKFDCIILDINLNGKNGGSVFLHLENNPTHLNAKTPVILSSGYISDEFIERHRARFYHILSKPFLAEELKVIVESIAPPAVAPAPVTKPVNSSDDDFEIETNKPFKMEDLGPKVKETLDKVKKSNKLKGLFQRALSDSQNKGVYKSHIGLTINIAAALLKAMGWDSDQTIEKVIYAAYLHDIAIKDRPDLQEYQTGLDFEIKGDKLSAADIELVKSHPQKAFEILKDYPEIPPDVPEMILQHHERADGGGFPAKIDHKRITPLATLFILSHEMAHAVLKSPNFELKTYISEVTRRHKGPQFRKVTRAMGSLI